MVFSVSDYLHLAKEGDHTPAFQRCFAEAQEAGGSILIPPGDYLLLGTVPLFSHLQIEATGARMHFSKTLPQHRATMFYGEEIRDLSWHGGCFLGYVYDPTRGENLWEPHAESVAIRIKGGGGISLSQVNGKDLAGCVFFAEGTEEAPLEDIHLSEMHTENCGRFMWDYGYLWQRITYPEYHTKEEVANAYRYLPEEYYSAPLSVKNGRLSSKRMPTAAPEDDTVSFFGDGIPSPLKKGKFYYAEEGEGGLLVREALDGDPILLPEGDYTFQLFRGLYRSYHMMYAPKGGGVSKGGMDIRFAKGVFMKSCVLSASGDAMHFHHCHGGEISHCQLTGARMGAMFLSAGCSDFTVSHNRVEGGNCSRILTVESGGKNILIEDNLFTGGGRGTWIDTPQGITLRRNVFEHNTGKSTPNPKVGRLSPTEGEYEKYAEIYFTTRTQGAVFRDILMEENTVLTGEGCTAAVVCLSHGKGITLRNNRILGEAPYLYFSPECEDLTLGEGESALARLSAVPKESFDIPGWVYRPEGCRLRSEIMQKHKKTL